MTERQGASVRNVRVSLDVSALRLRLVIEDDGDPPDTRQPVATLGLRSIASRAMAAHGQLQVGRAGSGGTAIVFECAQDAAGPEVDAVPADTAPSWSAPMADTLAGGDRGIPRPSPSARLLLDSALLVAAYVAAGVAGCG